MAAPKNSTVMTLERTPGRKTASVGFVHVKSGRAVSGVVKVHASWSAHAESKLPKVSPAALEFSRQAQLVLAGKADVSTLVLSEALLKERAPVLAKMRPLAEMDVDAFAEAMVECDW